MKKFQVDPRFSENEVDETANITHYSPNKIILQVNLKKSGMLFLSEVWYPGWKAYDNGSTVDIIKVNHIFRGIYLDAGRHDIVMSLEPPSLKTGLLITLITSLLVLGCIIVKILKNRRF